MIPVNPSEQPAMSSNRHDRHDDPFVACRRCGHVPFVEREMLTLAKRNYFMLGLTAGIVGSVVGFLIAAVVLR